MPDEPDEGQAGAVPAGLPALVAAAGRDDGSSLATRARALAALIPTLTASARHAGLRAVTAGRWLAETVIEIVPHLTVRDAQALRRQYPGLADDEIAARLVHSAARVTAAIGAAAGSLAAIEFTAPPALLASPVQLAAETVAVVAVEVRLVAELHEIAGLAIPGGMRVAGPAYLAAWVDRAAATPGQTVGLANLLTATATRQLRNRLLRRMGRSATSMMPFMAGAVAGAEVNRRATHDLGERIRAELRGLRHRRADIVIE
jgi:hypothetical protein